MSRISRTNAWRIAAAVFFGGFVAYYVLAVGIHAKKAMVIVEGAVYASIFTLMIALPTGLTGAFGGLLAFGAMVISGIRTYQLRNLWLLRRPPPYSPVRAQANRMAPPQLTNPPPPMGSPIPGAGPQMAPQPASRPVSQKSRPAEASRSWGPSSPLVWVSSTARNNKYRLPSEAYVTILETCQTLDSLVELERVEPSRDASFEYELDAMVNQYLPGVLKGYLAIPPDMVEQKQPNGKTPNDELVEQLTLLAGQAQNLHATRHGRTASELSSMGNFLRDRFGHQSQNSFDFGIE